MLIKCPECDLQVSDKAYACPHCGYPMSSQAKNITRKTSKRKRLPNGFGQISEIKGRNLRKPFRVLVTVGKDENGRPISRPLKPDAYFKTYNEAYTALIEYNRNPYDLEADATLTTLYERFLKQHAEGKSASTLNGYNVVWKALQPIATVDVRSIRPVTVKAFLDDVENPIKRSNIKHLLNMLFDIALEAGIIDKNPSRAVSINAQYTPSEDAHSIYTDDELAILWQNLNFPGVDLVLIQCYTGLRPRELCEIKLEDFNHDEMYAYGGLKTKAGKNRVIPFHSRIAPLVEIHYQRALELNSKYLFTMKTRAGWELDYRKYFYFVQTKLPSVLPNSTHKGHDGRLTFATMAKRAGVDEYVIKLVMGHTISDITESVYTRRDPMWLKEEIEKIK